MQIKLLKNNKVIGNYKQKSTAAFALRKLGYEAAVVERVIAKVKSGTVNSIEVEQ